MSKPITVQRFTNEALITMRRLAQENPQYWRDPETDFLQLLKEQSVPHPTEDAGLNALEPIRMPEPDPRNIQMSDQRALEFRNNIPGMEARHMADPNLLAWISCMKLLPYGIARWPIHSNREPGGWALQHFLSGDAREMSNASVAGRLLWLSEISRRAARATGCLTPQEVLDHYAGHTESYHIQNEFHVLRAPATMAAYIQAVMEDARGVSGKGTREIARDLNRAAGARLLDVMSRRSLREITSQSVDRVMRIPGYVSDRTRLRGHPPMQILSLGAGAQSSCLALMADQGYEGLEKPICAIFADTGWEPPAVYQHLDWLETQLSFPVHRVTAGNIRDDLLEGHTPTGKDFIAIPVHTRSPDGHEGMGKRQCTSEYKLKPIFQKVRELLEIPRGRRAPKGKHAEMWIGITTDEADRAKPSREEYISNRHPFLEMDISRHQLIDWFHRNYPGRELPRSACIGCPYRSNAEWKDLRSQDPDSFEDAANVDWALRNVPNLRAISSVEMFLSNQRIPLRELDLDQTHSGAELHRQECEGMCWI